MNLECLNYTNTLDSLYCFIPMSMTQFMCMANIRIESKVELIFENGLFQELIVKEVIGKEPLDAQNLKKFMKIVELYRDDIVRKWIDFFVYNKVIASEKITRKI